jgi:hypothetical protein
MTENSRHRNREPEDFLRYTQDQMSEEERNAFERYLQQDPFAAEALEGLSSLMPEEAKDDLARLREKLRQRATRPAKIARSTRTMWYRMAAAVALLLLVTSVLFTLFNDRLGLLDRKVAESPEAEKEAPMPATPAIQTPVEVPGNEEAPVMERKESLPADPVVEKTDKELEQTELRVVEGEIPAEAEVVADEVEVIADEAIEPEHAREERDEIQAMAVPARAMDRQPAAKSRKLEQVEQLQTAGAAAAEPQIISGIVLSGEDEKPVPGAFIAVKGSNTGTITDEEGRFEISLHDDSINALIAQFIGMKSKEIPVGAERDITVSMEPDALSLEEVVVIGIAPRKKAQLTSSAVALSEYETEQDNSAKIIATPVGGKKRFNEYVKSNIKFPESEETLSKAVVVLNFIVLQDGRPDQVKVLRSPGEDFSEEAIRLLVTGPDWEPAQMDGNYYEQPVRIRIVFRK